MVETEVVDVETITPKSTRAKARQHEFIFDKPSGGDLGPMSSEYWAASLASCHITTAHKVAERRRKPIEKISITATTTIDGDFITKVFLDIRVQADLPADEVDTVFRLTERICTISKATSVPVERKIRLMPAKKAP